jgi:hypothetical protein
LKPPTPARQALHIGVHVRAAAALPMVAALCFAGLPREAGAWGNLLLLEAPPAQTA